MTAPAPESADDWDTHWGDYASTAQDNPAQRFRRELAFELLERSGRPQRLFDIGAGQGDLLAHAVERWPDAEVAGVELSATGVTETLRKVPSARIVHANLLRDTAPDDLAGWATHAVCSEVLEHVDEPVVLLRNALKYLAPGCHVVVTVPGGPRSAFDKHIGHRRHFDRRSIESVLVEAGLEDVDVQAAGFPVFNIYKLVVILRGKRVITDAHADSPSGMAATGMRVFGRLFPLARRRGRLGWQIVATGVVASPQPPSGGPPSPITERLPGGSEPTYVRTFPTPQNAVDIFRESWSSRLPLDVVSGTAELFDDHRIHWLLDQIGDVTGCSVLELGPLEAGHTTMLSKAGANVVAVESNSLAFLKCLIVKELLDLTNCSFLHGDFVEYLRGCERRFDLVLASGVLYHATDPLHLLELIADVSDRAAIWTHYFDADIILGQPNLARQFTAAPCRQQLNGVTCDLYRRDYLEALDWSGFCGGPESHAMWLDRRSIIDALGALGFGDVRVGFEDLVHPAGPNILLLATK